MSIRTVNEGMSICNRGLVGAQEDIRRRAREGDAESANIIEGQEKSEFMWTLLQEAVIGKLGKMTSAAA